MTLSRVQENEPLVRLGGASVVYKVKTGLLSSKGLRAVDGVELSIGSGRIMALVGESACGKTTLGRLSLGLVRPTQGSLFFKGIDVWKMDEEQFRAFRRSAQIVHQDPYASLNPYKTVRDILGAPVRHYKLAKGRVEIDRFVSGYLGDMGLSPPEEYLGKYPFELSGGQRQRVAIARAMIPGPEYIVADEPVTMLDASLRIGILEILRRLSETKHLSILFITHDLLIANYLARNQQIAVMYLGEIVEFGKGGEVISDPLHPYTRALVSASPEPDPKKTRSKKILELKKVDPPDPANPPKGCKFNDRCPYVFDRCLEERPRLREAAARHFVACHLL